CGVRIHGDCEMQVGGVVEVGLERRVEIHRRLLQPADLQDADRTALDDADLCVVPTQRWLLGGVGSSTRV
ncbi:MAG: hypothetical protein ACYCXD_08000, partial [Coriobacteriia bacterium]